MIDHLPGNSHYTAARMNDPEYVAGLLDVVDPDEQRGEPQAEWSSVDTKLAVLIDLAQQQLQATVAATGTKPKPFKPYPRPESLLPQMREERRLADLGSLRDWWASLPEAEPT